MTPNTPTTQMQYVRLGATGLRVSRFCVGCMTYGNSEWNGWCKNEDESLALIKMAYDAGLNFFDTAESYSNGQSELILGKAIKKYNLDRSRIVVATKVFFPVLPGNTPFFMTMEDRMRNSSLVNTFGLSRKHIFDSVEGSLQRLGLDYIDLYQVHRVDQNTPLEETMEALNDLIRMGKIRYIGTSNMRAWEIQKANNIAERRGWAKFVSVQNLYNLLYREDEREVNPYSLDAGIGLIPYSPLSRGKLTGQHRTTVRTEAATSVPFMTFTDADTMIIQRVAEVAEKKGVRPAQVALAWLLAKPCVTSPIVGIGNEAHLQDIIGSLSVNLTADEVTYLEEAYIPKPLM
ncbi:hypothetical protein DFQ27_001345 [Actinomortierella ambigua]|uniref:NADP-dependent oxidoreductase domain-containing protein n=1 Tax=Actinomortierella ambigua TaxID=1343610 RepID=A0A9P6QEK9_9FUNG|nr:hypothetical protein DFQ27_001345 [Actinomortierella ambigua]